MSCAAKKLTALATADTRPEPVVLRLEAASHEALQVTMPPHVGARCAKSSVKVLQVVPDGSPKTAVSSSYDSLRGCQCNDNITPELSFGTDRT